VKVIIVGAHGEAKELINRISSGWSISVVDIDQDKLRNFTTNRKNKWRWYFRISFKKSWIRTSNSCCYPYPR